MLNGGTYYKVWVQIERGRETPNGVDDEFTNVSEPMCLAEFGSLNAAVAFLRRLPGFGTDGELVLIKEETASGG